MSVGRTEVTNVQTCEDIIRLFGERRFPVVVSPQHRPAFLFVDQVHLLRQTVEPPSPPVIGRTRRQVHEILGKTAFERVDSHMVVIEHNEQVVLVHRGVVQSLKSQTARHSSVSDDGYGMMAFLFERGGLFSLSEAICYVDSQRRGNRITRVPCDECIVLALARIRERTESFELAVGMKTVATSGKNLMGISLMAYVPNQFVLRSVEYIMQRHRQFDRTQRGTQMPRILTQRIDDELA